MTTEHGRVAPELRPLHRRRRWPIAVTVLACLALFMAGVRASAAPEPPDDEAGKTAAAAHLKQGIEFRKQGQFAPAEEQLTLAISAYPSAGLLYSERGQIRYLRKNYSGAVADFSVYLAQAPRDARILLLRSQARRFLRPADRTGACADFAELSLLDPSLSHIEGMDRYCR